MSTAVPHYRHSLAEYVAIEDQSPVRHEYLGGEIVAMAGGTPEHAAVAAAVTTLLGGQLRGRPCRMYSSDLRLRVLETGLATYADASVVCGELERDPDSPTHVTNPSLVVEVLSPSTEAYDRGEKREHYQKIASLDAYVLVESSRRRVEVYRRENGFRQEVYGPAETVRFSAIQCDLSVDELFDLAGVR
ncbi:MAG TPA: Uma2 family endonuclease [Polyangiaceae bacterium]|nr:Uma2 family endonuclease [Polyangiaceae bacterium]